MSEQKLFPVQSSILSPEALRNEVKLRYDIEAVICRLWSAGLNDVYQVKTKDLCYYLRISHVGRYQRIDYEEEVSILLQLKKRGIPVCVPISLRNGELLWEVNAPEGVRYAVLFEEAKRDDSNDLNEMGKMAANLHIAADDMKLQLHREAITYHQLIEHPILALKECGLVDAHRIEQINEQASQLWNQIESGIPKTEPYYGFCHGDMHSGNIYFYQGKPKMFDFDCMGYGYRAYELAVYLWDETMAHENFIESDEWKRYLNGYEDVRKLSQAEVQLIPAFAALRQLWFIAVILDATKINNSWDGIHSYFFEHEFQQFEYWYQKYTNEK